MKRLLCAALAVVSLGRARADAQSLADAARQSEERKKARGANTLVFDERDLDPARARDEVYAFTLDEDGWQKFVRADTAVARAIETDPGILTRLERLRASSVRSLERFVRREPGLLRALASAGVAPYDYTYTQLALTLAIGEVDSAPDRLDELPSAVRANVAFLKRRRADVEAVAPRLAQVKLRMAPPPTAAAAAGPGPLPEASAPVSVGMTGTGPEVPDFAFVDFDGGTRTLSEFRGRYVLLDFWGSWCRPCRNEIPYMKDAYARFRARGLEVVGMDYEEGASVADVRAYLLQQGVTWTFATPDSVRGIIVDGFQVRSFPTLVLLDPAGRMMAVPTPMLRGSQLAGTLDRVLPQLRP